jgi:hypothetical protein
MPTLIERPMGWSSGGSWRKTIQWRIRNISHGYSKGLMPGINGETKTVKYCRTSTGRNSAGRTSPGRASPERTSPRRTSWRHTSPGANLPTSTLDEAHLVEAHLIEAYLTKAYLRGADLDRDSIGWTVFGDVDLTTVRGLEAVRHKGPSTIGIDTLYRSQGNILEVFLQGAGVSDKMITYSKSLVGQPF